MKTEYQTASLEKGRYFIMRGVDMGKIRKLCEEHGFLQELKELKINCIEITPSFELVEDIEAINQTD